MPSPITTPTNRNGDSQLVHTEKLNKSLVVENVTVIETTKRIEVPEVVFVPKEQIKYVTKEEPTIKYLTEIKDTIVYVPKEVETVKYNVRQEETIKFIPKEVEIEKPKFVEKTYEIPVKKEVPFEVLTISDMENVKTLNKSVPEVIRAIMSISTLTDEVKKLREELQKLRDIKLVEEIIRVPKIEYVTRQEERIVWKDVVRERP